MTVEGVLSMSVPSFEHPLPWTEDEYLALGETANRVELIDGSLLVSPAASPPHQRISRRLANAFDPGAEAVGLEVLEAVNIRLKRGRIPIPDIVVVEPVGPDPVIDASVVRLVCEIVSPGNPATDRVLKMHYYAEAQIPFYLLVEIQPQLILRLFRLDIDGYREEFVATSGNPLRITEPFRLVLDPVELERAPGRPAKPLE